MRPVNGDGATGVGDDGWEDGPGDPRDELRFAVRYGEYPGGENAYWHDLRAGLIAYFRHLKKQYDSDEEQSEENESQWADAQTYYALRRRVYDLSLVVASAAEITGRKIAHWLVKERGFPWRDECSWGDLRRIVTFLEAPGVIDLARRAPDYPDWRDRAAGGCVNSEDTQEEDSEPLTLAQVHDVILRYATDEVTVNVAVRLLGATFEAAAADREELRDSDGDSSADALDVLAYDRVWALGETRYRVLMKALLART